MIRRGAPLSRFLAMLIVLSPLLLAGGAFSAWAIARWIDGGRALAVAEQARHEADALSAQARLFAPLREAWNDYAVTAASGLAQEETAEDAAAALSARLNAAFEASKSRLRSIERLADGAPPRPGLSRLRFEVLGAAPEAELPGLLAAIEGETPFAFIEFLDMRRAGAVGASRAPGVTLRMRVSLYRLEGGAL